VRDIVAQRGLMTAAAFEQLVEQAAIEGNISMALR
jgi:hypothetical protein